MKTPADAGGRVAYDQPHDDSEQMMRMHYGDDDSSAAYDAEMERQRSHESYIKRATEGIHAIGKDIGDEHTLRTWKAMGKMLHPDKCSICGGPLPSERDQETGTCKVCRTLGDVVR